VLPYPTQESANALEAEDASNTAPFLGCMPLGKLFNISYPDLQSRNKNGCGSHRFLKVPKEICFH
jgi:hypothetical protein